MVVNGSRDDVAKHASDDTRVVIEDMAWDDVDVDGQAAPNDWLLGIENIVLRIRHHVAVDSSNGVGMCYQSRVRVRVRERASG